MSRYSHDNGILDPILGMETPEDSFIPNSTKSVQSKVIQSALNEKQNLLTFDDRPTQNSNNPVKSGGIYNTLLNKINATDIFAWAKAPTKPSYTASEVGAIELTSKGVANGVAELDESGKIPSSQLPSFIDEVLEFASVSSFPAEGIAGKIYVAEDTNTTYRWSGSTYVTIGSSLALGETSSTAYRGDRGKVAYNHSQITSGNPHNVTKAEIGLDNVPNVTTDDQTPTYTEASTLSNLISGEKISISFGKIMKAISLLIDHIGDTSNPHSVTKTQVGLGNVGNFKAVSTVSSQGLTDVEKANARSNIGAGTGSSNLTLGESSITAYYGDKGKIAYDHSQSTHARSDATKTEASATNGNIKIDGVETVVYTHPGNGTNPHGTTKSDIGLSNVGNYKAVSTEANQNLTDAEKANARSNIGAGASSFSGNYNDLSNKPTLGTAAAKDIATSGNASNTQVVMGNDTRLTDSRNAADVYSWAKTSTKPSYTASEIGLGKVGNFKAVSTEANQGLTETEKANARANIGAGANDLALGETSTTAYRGDRGKIAYDHSQSTHARTDATKTEASSTNGNIKINGSETTVYTHPGSGTNPHGTTKSDVGLGNVTNYDQSKAIKSITRSGTTFTATALDGSTSTFSQQDNNTTYAAGTGVTITGTNNAINVTYGSSANTACQGNDSRLSNSRTPTSHASSTTTYGVGDANNYGHVKVDASLSTSSTNPVQNKVITAALSTVSGGSSLENIKDSTTSGNIGGVIEGATKTINDYEMSSSYICDIIPNEANGDFSHAEGLGYRKNDNSYKLVANGLASHAEGMRTSAIGESSHAEGSMTCANGMYSHAEGEYTRAISWCSHAEGYSTSANGSYTDGSHAEGYRTSAYGSGNHAEGNTTCAIGSYGAHTEGQETIASGSFGAHAEGQETSSVGGYGSHAEGYKTCANNNYGSHAEGQETSSVGGYGSHAEGKQTIANKYSSHAEGQETTANAEASHAEGYQTSAQGEKGTHAEGYQTCVYKSGSSSSSNNEGAHAEGYQTYALNGKGAHAEGKGTKALSTGSHAEGEQTTAQGDCAHSEGYQTFANTNGHAEGKETIAFVYAHAEGYQTKASEYYSHAEGYQTSASGTSSHAGGYVTVANYCQTTIGQYNVQKGNTSSYTSNSGYFIVGSGSSSAKANCFRVTESNTYGKTYATSGADYAEMFEWLDGNQNNEDRIGKFVTLKGNKIKLATSEDFYILGIVSGNASVIGNIYDDQWQGMFETDIYGRPIYEKQERELEDGTVVYDDVLKVSENYDNTQTYIPRSQRPEWSTVGLVGQLICLDDGTAEVDGFIKVNDDSIATKANEVTKYRVMERLDENHIQIMIL